MKTRTAKFWAPSSRESAVKSEPKNFDELLKLEKVTIKNAPFLDVAGFTTIELIAKATIEELKAVETIGEATAVSINTEAKSLTEE